MADRYCPAKFTQATGNEISVIRVVIDDQAAAHGFRHHAQSPP
jgi:hypothetical protein